MKAKLNLNPEAERERFDFYVQRDGIALAREVMLRNKGVYLACLRDQKKKGWRNHPYRFTYAESAFSIRHILSGPNQSTSLHDQLPRVNPAFQAEVDAAYQADVDAAIEAATVRREAELKHAALARPMFRREGTADWYDGHPDLHDAGGPYEVRTLYAEPVAEPLVPVGWFRRSDLEDLRFANGMSLWAEGPLMYQPECQEPAPHDQVQLFMVAEGAHRVVAPLTGSEIDDAFDAAKAQLCLTTGDHKAHRRAIVRAIEAAQNKKLKQQV